MFNYINNKFNVLPYTATYTQNGKSITNYTNNETQFKAYQNNGVIADLVVTQTNLTNEQATRLEEVNSLNLPITEFDNVEKYVAEGLFDTDSLLGKIKNEKLLKVRVETLENAMLDLLIGGM